ncbi:acetate--CoA ligase family protein [Marinobacterium rhizophilum]|uniref:Acetate--CoA ligase family protein n=1 Tax=Marinobacterium rhizophilum TaxID=420402 RepID=A0ABY5HKD7_9GAMM|nr:acetate--CoA ligase family protein [Marinobacterium rhizophilum]UTW12419.1 acetate--CoA ligase family protein [Marinobacterium rhizophilum]
MFETLIDIESLQRLFNPQSIAIIGASTDPQKIGGRPLALLQRQGFAGAIYPVNPASDRVQGLPAWANVADIPGPVDLAIIAVPGKLVEGALQACAAKGIGGAIIFSSGFSEVGETGVDAQQRLLAIARRTGIRVLGPNCMGVVNFTRAMPATFHPAFAASKMTAGNIGLVSQSGAFGGFSHYLAQDRGVSFSYLITTGNEADVELADGLAFLAADPSTKVILAYMEGCRNGPKLLEALELARRNRKPVVMVKLGSSEAGAAAAASHTAALAGSDEVFDAVLRQYGVYRASSVEEFFDIGLACSVGKLPPDARVGLVTPSGGMGVLMADDASRRGLDVAAMPQQAQRKIRDIIPFAGTQNPIDATGQVLSDLSILKQVADIVVTEGDYSSLVFFEGALARTQPSSPLADTWIEVARRHPDTLLSVVGLNRLEDRVRLQQAGIPVFEEPTHATRAVSALRFFARTFAKPWQSPSELQCQSQAGTLEAKRYSEVDALALLSSAGFPVVEHRLVNSATEAVEAAKCIDQPVVMKVVSPDILHKSDIGGVKLNLRGEGAVADAYESIMAVAKQAAPNARLDGCLVAPMVSNGVEVILGTYRDPTFGPVVMFGLGGIFVEVLKDVTFRVAPFGIEEARSMVGEIRGAAMLEGQRGQPPADVEALAQALSRLSVFAKQHESSLESIDINPFLVLPEGQGAVALDAVLVTAD